MDHGSQGRASKWNRANPFVLEGCHGDGTDISLGLEGLSLLEVLGLTSSQEECLAGSKDIAVGGAMMGQCRTQPQA